MFFYSWTNVSASASGSIKKRQECEHCKTWYCYTMHREAQAGSHQPYGIGVDNAEWRARDDARYELRRQLIEEFDAMPCPECGWLQAKMVALRTEQKFGWLRLFPLWAILIGLPVVPAVSVIAFLCVKLADGFVPLPLLVAAVATVYFMPIAVIWFRGRLRRATYDPNHPEGRTRRLKFARDHAWVVPAESAEEAERERTRPRRRRPITDESDWRKER